MSSIATPQPASMLRLICPANVASCETFRDDEFDANGPLGTLTDRERLRVARAIPSRIAEFATARRCARAAMADLGIRGDVPSGRYGEPIWPEGSVGSITHCRGFRGAIAAHSASWRGVGVDAEPDTPLPPDAATAAISSQDHLPEPLKDWAHLAFSAKEAAAKAGFGATGVLTDFRLSTVELNRHGTFTVQLPYGLQLKGRWARGCGLIVTFAGIPQLASIR